MTVGELKAKLDEYGDHLEVFVVVKGVLRPAVEVEDITHDGDLVVVVGGA